MIHALIDSGAVRSLIKPHVVEGFKGIRPSNIRLSDVQGNQLPHEGEVGLSVRINKRHSFYHKFIITSFAVFEADVLLGMDFLQQHNVVLDWGTRHCYIGRTRINMFSNEFINRQVGALNERRTKRVRRRRKKGWRRKLAWKKQRRQENANKTFVTTTTSEETLIKSPSDVTSEISPPVEPLRQGTRPRTAQGVGGSTLYADKKILIPPRSQMVIWAKLRQPRKISTPSVVVEPVQRINGVLIAYSLGTKKDYIPVKVMNTNAVEKQIDKNSVVGHVHELIEEVEEESADKICGVYVQDEREREEILGALKLSEVKDEKEVKLRELIIEYLDIFKAPTQKLTATSKVKHRILTTDDGPPLAKRPYRLPYHRKKIMEKEIQSLLDDGIIKESESPWSSPALLVAKKKLPGEPEEFRLCIDYRGLNAITKGDHYPLPNLQETLDKLTGATLFSTMDLASGYFQIELDERDQEKSAFSVPFGHYEFLRMSMGLKNAPATWQRFMGVVFSGLTDLDCLVYLDDVICFSNSNVDDHLAKLRKIFDRMRESNLKFKPSKCHFLQNRLKYLGHIISEKGCEVDPEKTDVVRNYPVPQNPTEVRAFLGLCSFYRRFIEKFADKAKPLTMLTKKNIKFNWTDEHEQAFKALKEALITPPVLKFPDMNKEFVLITDASQVAISAILNQKYDGLDHPVGYVSRTLTQTEQNYSTIERECLAVVYAVKHYSCFLIGTHFTIITDHLPLKYLFNIRDPSSRLAKWGMLLMEYDFSIEYKPGKTNPADSLTRLRNIPPEEPIIEPVEGTHKLNYPIAGISEEKEEYTPLVEVIWNHEEIRGLQHKEEWISEIIKAIESGNTTLEDGSYYFIDSNGLVYKQADQNDRNDKLVIPTPMVKDLIRIHHSTPMACHGGFQKTLDLLKQKFFWKTMRRDVQNFCEECHQCNRRRAKAPPAPLETMSIPCTVFGRCSLDLVGPLHLTDNGNKYILTCIDYLTRFAEAIPLADIQAKTVARAFATNIIARYGVPLELLTDCGSQFVSKLFKEICSTLEIKKIQTTPFHPATNGAVERYHAGLKKMLSHFIEKDKRNWDLYIPWALMAYRNFKHSSTQETPFFLMFGRDMLLPFHCTVLPTRIRYDLTENYCSEMLHRMQTAHEVARNTLYESAERRAQQFNKKAKVRSFDLGDRVYLYTPHIRDKHMSKKLCASWSGPYRIIKQLGPVTFVIKEINGRKEQTVHMNRLRHAKGNEDVRYKENQEEVTKMESDPEETNFWNNIPIPEDTTQLWRELASPQEPQKDTGEDTNDDNRSETFTDLIEELSNIATELEQTIEDAKQPSEELNMDTQETSNYSELWTDLRSSTLRSPENTDTEESAMESPTVVPTHPYGTRSKGPVKDMPNVLDRPI